MPDPVTRTAPSPSANRAGALALIAAIFTGVPGLIAVRYMDNARSSASWPTTEGIVTESGWSASGGKTCPYDLRLRYVYTLGGQHYGGSNYRFGGVCTEEVRQIAAANPVGKRILVHYRPAHPDDSVIVPGSAVSDMAPRLFTSLGFSALAFILYRMVRKR